MLTDERLAELVAEYREVVAELRPLEGLKDTYLARAEREKVPERRPAVGSMAEWNMAALEEEEGRRLVAPSLSAIKERLVRLEERRLNVLASLEDEGMPTNTWIGLAHEPGLCVLLERAPESPSALRGASREAVERSPAGASPKKVENLSRELRAWAEAGSVRRALPTALIVVRLVLAVALMIYLVYAFWWLLGEANEFLRDMFAPGPSERTFVDGDFGWRLGVFVGFGAADWLLDRAEHAARIGAGAPDRLSLAER